MQVRNIPSIPSPAHIITSISIILGGNPIPPPAIAVVNAQANNADMAAVAIGIVGVGVAGDAVAAVVAVDEAAGGVAMLNDLEQAAAAAPGIVDEHV